MVEKFVQLEVSPKDWAVLLTLTVVYDILPEVRKNLVGPLVDVIKSLGAGNTPTLKVSLTLQELQAIKNIAPDNTPLSQSLQETVDTANAALQIGELYA